MSMRRRSNIIAVTVFLLATLGVFLISPRNRQRLQSMFLTLISPFLKKGSEVDTSWKTYGKGVKKLGELEAENADLKSKLNAALSELQSLRNVKVDNADLRKQLGFKNNGDYVLVPARVLGRPSANWWSTVMVDRGSADGVMEDSCALTADGFVGRVVQTAEHTSTILLLTDEKCKIAAQITDPKDPNRKAPEPGKLALEPSKQGIISAQLRGEVRGERVPISTQPQLVMSFIGRYEPLPADQPVYTSGAGQVYPPGILIGRVVESKSRELDKEAVIRPAADLINLTDVFIIAGMKGAQAQR